MEITPILWLILLTFGVAVLGGAMWFARSRNKKRTQAEKERTDAATRQEYRDEESGRR